MTKRQRRRYFRRWRASAKKRCECGQPATVPAADGAICQRCADLEYRRYRLTEWRARKRPLFSGMSEYHLGLPLSASRGMVGK
jgi:hypothetical protein